MLGRCARYRSERSGVFDAIVDVFGRRVVLVVVDVQILVAMRAGEAESKL